MNIFTHITNLIFLLEAELRELTPYEIRISVNLISPLHEAIFEVNVPYKSQNKD
jgi:hypothetical protein